MTNKFWRAPRHSLMARLFLLAQRNSGLVPTPVKRSLKGLLSSAFTADIATVEDWSRPLVPGPEVSTLRWPLPTHAEHSESGIHRYRRGIRGTEIRCLLATESLDAGGMDEVVAFLARGLPQFGLQVACSIRRAKVRAH